jgi:hypothetical protein
MRWLILPLFLISTTAAFGDEPSATAKAERARTVELKRQRQAKKSARAAAQTVARAQATAMLNNQMASSLQMQQASAEAARRAFVGGTPVRTPAPIVYGPDAVIVTRSSNGQVWTSVIYPGGQIYPPVSNGR